MPESQELVPMPETDEVKAEIKSRWQKLLDDLQQERDELRVRLNLARKEADEELDRIDARIEDFKQRARKARGEARDSGDDIEDAARKLWDELKEGFERVRKSFTSKE